MAQVSTYCLFKGPFTNLITYLLVSAGKPSILTWRYMGIRNSVCLPTIHHSAPPTCDHWSATTHRVTGQVDVIRPYKKHNSRQKNAWINVEKTYNLYLAGYGVPLGILVGFQGALDVLLKPPPSGWIFQPGSLPETNRPKPFQSSIFRGKLLVSRRIIPDQREVKMEADSGSATKCGSHNHHRSSYPAFFNPS